MDTNRNGGDGNDAYDEYIPGVGSRIGNGSSERRRTESQGYLDSALEAQREIADTKTEGIMGFPSSYRETAVSSERDPSPLGRMLRCAKSTAKLIASILDRPTPSHVDRHRVPYFRYFGPTAIVPGFKQMVVSVREHHRSTGAGSSGGSMFSWSRLMVKANANQYLLAQEATVEGPYTRERLLKLGLSHGQLLKCQYTTRTTRCLSTD